MASKFTILWSDESVRNLEEILNYLEKEWTWREVERFKEQLLKQLNLIQQFPQLFPKSEINRRIRRAVMNRHITIYYEIKGNRIQLAYLFNNRKDPSKLK